MGLMPVMSEWVQENTSMLQSKTCRKFSFSSLDKRELTDVCLFGLPRSIDFRGSIANCSLSSEPVRAASCDCYSGSWVLEAGLLELSPFSHSCTGS